MGEEASQFNRNNKHSVQRQKGKILSTRKVAESTLAREEVVCWVPGWPSGVEPKESCLQNTAVLTWSSGHSPESSHFSGLSSALTTFQAGGERSAHAGLSGLGSGLGYFIPIKLLFVTQRTPQRPPPWLLSGSGPEGGRSLQGEATQSDPGLRRSPCRATGGGGGRPTARPHVSRRGTPGTSASARPPVPRSGGDRLLACPAPPGRTHRAGPRRARGRRHVCPATPGNRRRPRGPEAGPGGWRGPRSRVCGGSFPVAWAAPSPSGPPGFRQATPAGPLHAARHRLSEGREARRAPTRGPRAARGVAGRPDRPARAPPENGTPQAAGALGPRKRNAALRPPAAAGGGRQAGRFRFRAWPRRLPAVTEAADRAPARGGAPGFASLGGGAVPRSARVGLPERWREAVTVPELAAGWRRARRTAAGDGAGPGPRRPGPTGCRSTRTGWTCGSSCSWTCCSSSSCTSCPDGFADIPRSLDCGVNSENELQSS